jgi:ER membrane protein complex subunit 1
VINFVKRFATGSYASATSPATISTPSSDTPRTLIRDPFGSRQVIVVATMLGKVYGLDSADGSVLWSRVLGLGWAGETGVGGTVHVAKIFAVGDLEGGGHEGKKAGPQVALVAQRRAKNVCFILCHFCSLTQSVLLIPSRFGTTDTSGYSHFPY